MSSEERQKALKFQKEMFPNGIEACGADALRLTLVQRLVSGEYYFSNQFNCSYDLILGCHF